MGLNNPTHIAFILILLLLVFGAKRLPEIGRSLGSGMRGFKDSLSGAVSHSEGTSEVAANQDGRRSVMTSEPKLDRPVYTHHERSLK